MSLIGMKMSLRLQNILFFLSIFLLSQQEHMKVSNLRVYIQLTRTHQKDYYFYKEPVFEILFEFDSSFPRQYRVLANCSAWTNRSEPCVEDQICVIGDKKLQQQVWSDVKEVGPSGQFDPGSQWNWYQGVGSISFLVNENIDCFECTVQIFTHGIDGSSWVRGTVSDPVFVQFPPADVSSQRQHCTYVTWVQ